MYTGCLTTTPMTRPSILQCLLLSINSAVAAPVDFNRDIRPILSANCLACHGPEEDGRKADLRLDSFADACKDLGGYAAIVPGKPDESELIARVEHGDPDEVMPPQKLAIL